ncbi:fasciclin [Pseudoclavibacter sp. RFBJ3]|uniref:fasciclin domain-containing protein n=1 Tax=unclassified Pseudoclavibacter TaxID=2615177 RepID=UPI000CE74E3E|nr:MULTISPECIES: fasciclin domain-containing protein [unclassified Pseudoclavibacter]MBF4460149.1 fasciclin domain-containing protein [Pseudoclavibacter sp. VKM Ac-2867]MBF4552370.1 fasciclin domain-containing protein [Pseudoclavibacter sp. VKM Ac-2888]PPF32293.1 fasciclin [Pseudoclavibacter sp. AY1H1]PPF71864.1 fasciclin [Pseudoclavibacter sp. Z016]PPF79797.1 fasciclin [Pseudoclavibacter sp. RFBJ5]
MRTITRKGSLALLSLAAISTFGLAACSNSAPMAETDASTEASPMETAMETPMETTMETMDPAANLVGSGCADYAAQVPDGAGSVQGMSQDPVAVAASNNPLLTQLTAAVSGQLNPDVDLVSTLNGGEFTVFAPVDEAFGKIDAGTIDTLKTDADLLSGILTYHVVEGQILPDEIAGDHKTVQGENVTVTGEGDNLMVGDAKVICGGVQTANATVYLIDSVLMPPSMM